MYKGSVYKYSKPVKPISGSSVHEHGRCGCTLAKERSRCGCGKFKKVEKSSCGCGRF